MTAFSRFEVINVKIKTFVILAFAGILSGCGGSSGGSTADACNELNSSDFNCETMLNDLVTEGVTPVMQQLATTTASLNTEMASYCGAINDAAKLTSAENAWTSVMQPLQQLQVMNFGPNSASDNGLLSFYDWESANAYNIDIAIAKSSLFDQVGLSNSDNEKDLVAVEYIIFAPGEVQAYADQSKENQNVFNWRNGKTSDQIQQDRCAYAMLITADLETRSASLLSQWQQFDLSSVSNSKQVAANKVAEALFYLDKITKDAKIKATLPQADDNAAEFNSSKLESKFAKQSKEAILNNLIGVKTILTLNDSDNSKTGLDDYLKAAGQQATATGMIEALNTAIANTNAIGNDIFTAVDTAGNANVDENESSCKEYSSDSLDYVDADSDIKRFCALQNNVKSVTDILKGDFTFLTSFTVPASASGDND